MELRSDHADSAKARAALMRVSALLQEWVVRVTEQLNPTTVWILVCDQAYYCQYWPSSKCQIDYKSEQWKRLTEVFRMIRMSYINSCSVGPKL